MLYTTRGTWETENAICTGIYSSLRVGLDSATNYGAGLNLQNFTTTDEDGE